MRGRRWRGTAVPRQRRGGATRRYGTIQSSASCDELAYSTRNVQMRIFGSRFRQPPCRCATAVAARHFPSWSQEGSPKNVQFPDSRFRGNDKPTHTGCESLWPLWSSGFSDTLLELAGNCRRFGGKRQSKIDRNQGSVKVLSPPLRSGY